MTAPLQPAVPVEQLPADPSLLRADRLAEDVFQRWLPWHEEAGVIWVATCVPVTTALRREVTERLGYDQVAFCHVEHSELAATAKKLLPQELAHEAAERFALENPAFSAKGGLTWWQGLLPAAFIAATVVGLLLDWRVTLIALVTLANLVFMANVGFKLLASGFRPFRALKELRLRAAEKRGQGVAHTTPVDGVDTPAPAALRDEDLPRYTILVPVYHEANVIGQILHNFERLDYPTDKLEVLVLLEADDDETIAAARAADPPAHMQLLIVPEGEPRTKPRACNYGLLFATGTYVVIFDAEDRPDPDQLKRVLVSFRHDADIHPRRSVTHPLACVQASLNYYNADYNVLTRMFAIEYAHWFDSMLPGMDSANTPMPLGGTSNHFLRRALLDAGGWDPYNVTEDADLGIRLAAAGYRVNVVASTTWEEATSQVGAWIRQRTRWIKGYILTAAVNLRHPISWVVRNGPRAAITMFGLVLGTPLAFLMYPLALGFTLLTWALGPVVEIWLPSWLLILGFVNMVLLNLVMVVSSGLAAWRRYGWRIAAFAVFLPLYWLLHSVAAWRAAIQLSYDPFGWEKTPHGLTEEYDDGMFDAHGLPHSAST